jgi:hypothetical protein
MNNLINFFAATVCWLGLFEQDLIQPLLLLPLASVLSALTAVDYLLWAITFLAVAFAVRLVDYITGRNETPAGPISREPRRPRKRGDQANRPW